MRLSYPQTKRIEEIRLCAADIYAELKTLPEMVNRLSELYPEENQELLYALIVGIDTCVELDIK